MSVSIAVDGTGYLTAVERLRTANHAAAAQCHDLARDLHDTGAMIGNPTVAGPMATAYDRAADTLLETRATLTQTLTGLGLTTATSLVNHTRAELASVIGHVHHLDDPDDLDDLGPGPDSLGWQQIHDAGSLPGSTGGTDADLPSWAREVIDLVQGFIWPDADTSKLRDAASAWRRSGYALSDITGEVRSAATALDVERSPEIPLAQDALNDLNTRLHTLASEHHQIATVCDQYADLVDDKRTAILTLVHEVKDRAEALKKEATEPDLDWLFPPLHAYRAADAALDLGRAVTDATPKFLGYLNEVRTAATDHAHTLDQITADLGELNYALAFTDPTKFPAPWAPDSWLRRHEGGEARGHTIKKHVGKTDRQLRRRLEREPRRKVVSTYPDEKTASGAIQAALAANSVEIDAWLRSSEDDLPPINYNAGMPIGRLMPRVGLPGPSSRLRVLLVRDSTMPEKYRVLTSYPIR